LGGNCPNGQFGTVGDANFAEDPVQVFLDSTFCEVQLVRNFLVELGLADEMDNLPLSEAELWIERLLDVLGGRAGRTDSFAALTTELTPASKAVSQLFEFNYGRHEFELQFTDLTLRPVAGMDAATPAAPLRVALRSAHSLVGTGAERHYEVAVS